MEDLEELEQRVMKMLEKIADHSDTRTVRGIMENVHSFAEDAIDECDEELAAEEDEEED